jgi:hypothetical protein
MDLRVGRLTAPAGSRLVQDRQDTRKLDGDLDAARAADMDRLVQFPQAGMDPLAPGPPASPES